MDISNYESAIASLRCSLSELQQNPGDPIIHYAVMHSFEIAHNLSEAVLREVYVSLGTDVYAPYLSLRELIWRAGEEGFILSSPKNWFEYGFALEGMREALSLSSGGELANAIHLLSRFADDLKSFSRCLERRLVNNA